MTHTAGRDDELCLHPYLAFSFFMRRAAGRTGGNAGEKSKGPKRLANRSRSRLHCCAMNKESKTRREAGGGLQTIDL